MALRDDEKRDISDEVRQEIGRILKTWGTLLGLTNVIVLGSLIGYIFFVIPERATEKVDDLVNERLKVEIEQINEDVERDLGRINTQVDRLVDTAIDKSTEAFEDAVELKSSLNMKSAEVGLFVVKGRKPTTRFSLNVVDEAQKMSEYH
jgi:hypothetical protein